MIDDSRAQRRLPPTSSGQISIRHSRGNLVA